MAEITRMKADAAVDFSHGVVVLEFSAQWCTTCKMLRPVLQKVAEAAGNDVNFWEVDVDENKKLAVQYQIQTLPTIVIIKENVETARFSGLQDKTKLLQAIDAAKN